jgi:hypothetical protein
MGRPSEQQGADQENRWIWLHNRHAVVVPLQQVVSVTTCGEGQISGGVANRRDPLEQVVLPPC